MNMFKHNEIISQETNWIYTRYRWSWIISMFDIVICCCCFVIVMKLFPKRQWIDPWSITTLIIKPTNDSYNKYLTTDDSFLYLHEPQSDHNPSTTRNYNYQPTFETPHTWPVPTSQTFQLTNFNSRYLICPSFQHTYNVWLFMQFNTLIQLLISVIISIIKDYQKFNVYNLNFEKIKQDQIFF